MAAINSLSIKKNINEYIVNKKIEHKSGHTFHFCLRSDQYYFAINHILVFIHSNGIEASKLQSVRHCLEKDLI